MTPYQVSSEIYCGFFYLGITLSMRTHLTALDVEVAILGADQKERGLWEREWRKRAPNLDGARRWREQIALPEISFRASDQIQRGEKYLYISRH